MALRIITAGPIAMAAFRRARRCTIRSAGQTTMCAHPRSRRRRALRTFMAANDIPIRDVLAFPPQQITGPLANRGSGLVVHRHRLRARCFCYWAGSAGCGAVQPRRGFRVLGAECHAPAPEIGHEVKLINFNQLPGSPLALRIQNFARNSTGDQAFVTNINGFNRPLNRQVRPGWMRLCRRLRRSARPRRRLALCGPTRQWSAGPDPRHRGDLEDLPDVALMQSVGGGYGRPFFCTAL